MIMKRFILMGLLCAFVSVSFAQQRKTQVRKVSISSSATNKSQVLNDSITILNSSILNLQDSINDLNNYIKSLQERYGLKVIGEQVAKDSTHYKLVGCEYSDSYVIVKLQLLNKYDDQILSFKTWNGLINCYSIIDNDNIRPTNFFLGNDAIINNVIKLNKNVVTNISFSFWVKDKLPKTLNLLVIHEENSKSDLKFSEIIINRNL